MNKNLMIAQARDIQVERAEYLQRTVTYFLSNPSLPNQEAVEEAMNDFRNAAEIVADANVLCDNCGHAESDHTDLYPLDREECIECGCAKYMCK
jgi:hypothetical protein